MFWLLSKEFVTHTEFWVLNAKLSCLTKASIWKWDIVCVYIQFLVAYNCLTVHVIFKVSRGHETNTNCCCA